MTEKTRVYLIRHGEVAGAGTPRYNGHADVALSEHGVAQYHQMKERFADARISACYTSDLSRCAIGAEIIGRHLGVTPVRERNLRELDIGAWEGKTWDELKANHTEEWQARLDDIVNYRVPGGKTCAISTTASCRSWTGSLRDTGAKRCSWSRTAGLTA